jgi:hypothetical protein
MAILGNTTINGSLNINGVPVEPGAGTLKVTCTTAGSTPAKEVVDASRVPVAGDIVIVTFTNGNSVSNPTLNINSSGPKYIRLGATNASTTTMTVGAGGVVPLYFDGTYYNMFGSYRTSDSNTYDRMLHGVAKQMGETLYRYKLILEGIDGKFYPIVTTNQTSATVVQKTPTNATLKIGGSILYYNTTTTVAANGTVNNTYSEINTANMVYSFNQNGGYQLQRPIYLVGIPQANGGYKLDSNYYTQDLPTTEDGKIYIRLGLVYAQNSLRLEIEHPIYEFKDGKVRPYIPEHTHETFDNFTEFNDDVVFNSYVSFYNELFVGSGYIEKDDGNVVLWTDSVATPAQAEAGIDNIKYMTPLRVKQSRIANPPRYVWKQQIVVEPDNIINLVTIMNNIGGVGEYLFEIIGYNGQWWGEIRLYAISPISVSGDGIVKISYIDSDFGGTISVYTIDNTHQSRCFYNDSSYPAFYADYENSDNIVINVYRLGW